MGDRISDREIDAIREKVAAVLIGRNSVASQDLINDAVADALSRWWSDAPSEVRTEASKPPTSTMRAGFGISA